MPRSDLDWASVLDIPQATRTCRSEMFGDWLRDPWSWPELRYLALHPEPVVDRLQSGRTRFERLTVPKINFGTRPGVAQSPIDRVAYHGVANSISARLIDDLPDFVGGWRLSRTDPKAGRLLKNKQEYLRFVAQRREGADAHDTLFASDITNFFGSIDVGRLVGVVEQRAARNAPVEALATILDNFDGLPDRRGLPQRSTASSILANAFLRPLDDVLQRYMSGKDATVLRWMDDLWVFGGSVDDLRCLQLDVQDCLRDIGLEINLGKTLIRDGDEADEVMRDCDLDREPPTMEINGDSGASYLAVHDPDDLLRQLERFIQRPERTDKTTISYLCGRIVDFERYDLIDSMLPGISQAPQGADHFSRLLGQSDKWRGLDEWWVELAESTSGLRRLPWPIAQLGTMFPADEPVPVVADHLATTIDEGFWPLELIGLAAHRLSKWKPDDARVLLRRVGTDSDSPLIRRTAAFALHNLGEDKVRTSAILKEFEENAAAGLVLDEQGNRPLAENKDFVSAWA